MGVKIEATGKHKRTIETKIKHQVVKKKASIEDLLIKNLIQTNMTLLKSLDLRGIVLF